MYWQHDIKSSGSAKATFPVQDAELFYFPMAKDSNRAIHVKFRPDFEGQR
jgi:hypothetical protein